MSCSGTIRLIAKDSSGEGGQKTIYRLYYANREVRDAIIERWTKDYSGRKMIHFIQIAPHDEDETVLISREVLPFKKQQLYAPKPKRKLIVHEIPPKIIRPPAIYKSIYNVPTYNY